MEECWNSTGKPRVKVKRTDTNEGDDVNHEIRSRSVGKEIKMDKRLDLSTATPTVGIQEHAVQRSGNRRGRIQSRRPGLRNENGLH